ncbi:MAG: DUF2975 domain-containing protein [Clostridiales bacterium]|jgi:hypothetical protein|nr:DUF2975 domain-containing protein [Clostridiales bacterium]
MNQKSLSTWLKGAIICLALIGAAVYAFVIPQYGHTIRALESYSVRYYWAWLIFVLISGIPCYIALVLGWKVSVQIGLDNSFSYVNAAMLRKVAVLAAADALYFFAGNIVFWIIGIYEPRDVLISLLPVGCAGAVSTAGAALSHLIRKAADIKNDNDLTI